MIYSKIIYLCFLILAIALLSSCLANDCRISADPTASKKAGHIPVEEEAIFEAAPQPVSFEYQLLTGQEKENKLLLYLKHPVNTMTIRSYDQMGRSKLMIKEQSLSRGFYNYTLPKATASNIQYWEVKLGSQRAVVFKK